MASKCGKGKNKETSSSQIQQSFQFINLTNSPHVDEYDRDIIRTKAISDYHRRKRNSNPRSSTPNVGEISKAHFKNFKLHPQGLEAQGDPSTSHRPRTDASKRRKLADANNLQTSISKSTKHEAAEEMIKNLDLLAGNLDPLISLPRNSSDRIRMLIHHYFNDRSLPSLLMVSARKSWLRASLQDPAFFTAVLSHYAARFSLSTQEGDPMEALRMRMDAIKMVNERLADADGSMSDGTIGAVASLVTYEANNGSLDAIRTHMAGLSKMITLRGGFHTAGFMPALQRLIGWAELTAVNVLSEPPTILSLASPGLDLPSYNCTAKPKGPIVPIRQCPGYEIDFSVLFKSITDIFANLRFLSAVLESKDPFSIAQIDNMWYSDRVYQVQRSLVYASLDTEQGAVETGCFIAGSMYVDSYLRDLGFYSRVIALMVTKLKNFLEQQVTVSIHEHGEDELVMIFWTLVIGGISAIGKPERAWFVERLREACEALKVPTKSDAEQVLEKILWSKEWLQRLEEIWQEIGI